VETKHIKTALEESENRFKVIFNNMQDVYFRTDLDGTIVMVSPSAATYYGVDSIEEVLEKNMVDEFYYYPEDRQKLISKLLDKGYVENYEVIFKRKDGSPVSGEANAHFVYDDDDNICGIEGILRDITERQRVQKELKEKTIHLEETNTALKVLLKKRELDKLEIEKSVLLNIDELIEPYITLLKKSGLNQKQMALVAVIESSFEKITSSFSRKLLSGISHLTPAEVQVANLIQHGKSTKEIASFLNLSPFTIKNHRGSIRKKLGIHKKRVNLRSYLSSLG
jgi:PAS domain S-box-containing protein